MTLVRDVMSREPKWIRPETTLCEAARTMRDYDIGFLLVGENDRMVGVVTDRDIAVRAVAEGFHPQSDTVRSVMTPGPYYCYDDQSAAQICENMAFIKVRRLPVVNREKRLVGVVSLGDLAQVCEEKKLAIAFCRITDSGRKAVKKATGRARVA